MSCILAVCEVWPAEHAGGFCRPHLMRLAWICYGKRRRNRTSAETAARQRGGMYASYDCPVCSRWHAGRQRPGTEERNAEVCAIIRELRAAGHIRLLAAMAEQWDPLQGALREGAWADKVRIT